MAIYGIQKNCCDQQQYSCPDEFGCVSGLCADFTIKQHDTLPPYRISVSDCNGPLDLTSSIVEVSMWALAKFKRAVLSTDTYFALADGIGFQQINIGDIIVIDRVRNPEQMVVSGFDETNKLVQVQRGYNGTQASDYKKGQKIKIFRILNSMGEVNIVEEEQTDVNTGETSTVVTEAQLIYNWLPADTCLPGCYWMEFKLLKMTPVTSMNYQDMYLNSCSTISVVPSFISSVSGCELGAGVESVRRFPVDADGFLIRIFPTPTNESLVS